MICEVSFKNLKSKESLRGFPEDADVQGGVMNLLQILISTRFTHKYDVETPTYTAKYD